MTDHLTQSPQGGAGNLPGRAPLEVVARHEAAALSALEAATGGAPLCRVDGTRQTVKASEGAAAALSDVRRALRRAHSVVAEGPALDAAQSVIHEVRTAWAGISGPLAARPGSEEYIAGGLEALAALEQDLVRVEPDSTAPSAVPGVLAGSPVLAHVVAGASGPATSQRWPRRRRVAAGSILVGLVVLVAATVGWPLGEAPLWASLTAATLVLSSLALALFVPRPGEGWRPDFGCAPCAVAGLALAVAGPWLAIETAHQGERAALALVLGGAALARRLTEPPVCGAPAGRAHPT
ncbi:hypothetical protein [Intrasporangium sp. DVR]|uniref:hypothetical protein n=1 Tax=Intrasporangium sp. DVR TaxID=3127867 RepID=UPI00313A6470